MESILTQFDILNRLCNYLSIEDLMRLRITKRFKYLLSSTCYVPINDPDYKILYIKGVNGTNYCIYKSIENVGSIYAYYRIDRQMLLNNGFPHPTPSDDILYATEYTDISMGIFKYGIEFVIWTIGDYGIVKTDDAIMKQNSEYYKHLKIYNIEYWGDYLHWLASSIDISRKNPGFDLKLVITLKVNTSEMKEIMRNVLPNLDYKIKSNKLTFDLSRMVPYLV